MTVWLGLTAAQTWAAGNLLILALMLVVTRLFIKWGAFPAFSPPRRPR